MSGSVVVVPIDNQASVIRGSPLGKLWHEKPTDDVRASHVDSGLLQEHALSCVIRLAPGITIGMC
jgi:hypothetical protein